MSGSEFDLDYGSPHRVPLSLTRVAGEEYDRHDWQVVRLTPRENGYRGEVVDGLPADLAGYVFIAAPIPASSDNHVLNGDGILYRLHFDSHGFKLRARLAKTPCYYADRAMVLQPQIYPLILPFRDGGPSRLSISLGSRNQLNTAFFRTRDRLLVTFDAGRPYEIDPESMELLGAVGDRSEWIGIFNNTPWLFPPFSNPAHPTSDRTADTPDSSDFLITVNYSTGYNGKWRVFTDLFNGFIEAKLKTFAPKLWGREFQSRDRIVPFADLVKYDFAKEKLERWQMVAEVPRDKTGKAVGEAQPIIPSQTMHQTGITEDYILVADIAFVTEFSQIFLPWYLASFLILEKVWESFSAPLLKSQWFASFGNRVYNIFMQLVPPENVTSFYIIDRRQWESILGGSTDTPCRDLPVKKITIPREVSHFAVDYANPDGKITMYIGHNNGSDVTEWVQKYDRPIDRPDLRDKFNPELRGAIVGATDLGSLAKYIIDGRTGNVIESHIYSNPRHSWSLSVYTHRELCRDRQSESAQKITQMYWQSWGFVWDSIPDRIFEIYKNRAFRGIPSSELPPENLPNQIFRLNTATMQVEDWFEFPPGYYSASPQFIPSSAPCPVDLDPAMHGYISCVVYRDSADGRSSRDEFWIFAADDLQGKTKPIYRLMCSQPLNIGFTIHSIWLPTIELGKYPDDRRRQMRETSFNADFSDIIARRGPIVQSLANDIMKPHFIQHTPAAVFDKSIQES